MGQGESRKIIDYATAEKWMGPQEVQLVRDAFNRLATGGRLEKETFRNGFLGSANLSVPTELSNALFNTFDVRSSGKITAEEFVCGLAVLRHGPEIVKLRFLFFLYDTGRQGQVTSSDLRSISRILSSDVSENTLRVLPSMSMDWEQFQRWALRRSRDPLVSWIFELERHLSAGYVPGVMDPPLQRTKSVEVWEEEEEIRDLILTTGLAAFEVKDLYAAFSEMKQASPHGVVDDEALRTALPSIPPHLRSGFLAAFDTTGSKTLSFREFVNGIAVCFLGPEVKQQHLSLQLFAGDGVAPSPEVAAALRRLAEDGIEAVQSCGEWWQEVQDSAAGTGGRVTDVSWLDDALAVVCMFGWLLRVDLQLQPPSPLEERMIVDSFAKKFDPKAPGPVGTTWYVISEHWWQKWCLLTGDDDIGNLPSSPTTSPKSRPSLSKSVSISSSKRLPAIDNAGLLDASGRLRFGLHHRIDYELLPDGCWQVLKGWYDHTGSEIACHVVDVEGVPELEVYPLVFAVRAAGHLERVLECSCVTPVPALKRDACALFGLQEPVRLLHRWDDAAVWEVVDDTIIPTARHLKGHSLMLELDTTEVRDFVAKRAASPTSVGLKNLGNTCYMNAALQCLLHTKLLREYFTLQYTYDLHPNTERSKEWGLAGKVAVAFGDLCSEISKATRSVVPDQLRRAMCKFKPEFDGWEQHDAQEFLAGLLEGLSEDVNRIPHKQYIELRDSQGRQDEDVAAEYWGVQMQRDWSVVVALFSGQFKSVLCCSACGAQNAKFDSFSIVQVPLPEHDFQWVTCAIVEPGPRQTRVCVRVPKSCLVADVVDAAAAIVGLPAGELLAADVSSGYIFTQLPGDEPWCSRAEVHLFHSPDVDAGLPVNIVHRRLKRMEQYFLNPYRTELFARPQIVRLPPNAAAVSLYIHVWHSVRLVVPDYMPEQGAWPFKISRVTRDGSVCSQCGWRQGCLGHAVLCDSLDPVELGADDTLALDWDGNVLADFYNERSATSVTEHESVALANIERDAPEQLDRCLQTLLHTEELTAYCSNCTKEAGDYTEVKQTREFKIWALPPILVFQLKRFRHVEGRSYKLENLVQCPLRLDVREYLGGGSDAAAGITLSRVQTKYTLYAVVNHSGGCGGGHYTAYVKCTGGQWVNCNDESCCSIAETDVVTHLAYLLFYVRDDVDGVSLDSIFPRVEGSMPQSLEVIRNAPWPKSKPQPLRPRASALHDSCQNCLVC